MDLTNLQTQVTNLLTIIIGGVISIVGIYATIYINKLKDIAKEKAQTIKDENAKKIVNDTINKTTNLITTSITALENTTKQELLQDIADGKIDKSELKTLSTKVKEQVLTQLGNKSIDILNEEIGDVNIYISNKVEEVLANLKINPNSAVSKTVIEEKPSVVETQAIQEEVKESVTDNVVNENSASSKITVDNPENIQEIGATVNPVSSVVPQ